MQLDGATMATVRTWLELAYFVSGILTALLVAFGLRQLTLAKRQMETTKEIFRTQSRRASVEMAVVECRRFAETIIQDKLALDKFCRDNNVTFFEKATFKRTEEGFTVDVSDTDDGDIDKFKTAHELLNRILNGLEAHALFFLSGVADEDIAFLSIAKPYVNLCEQLFKLFPILNVEEEDAAPIKTLYFRWRKKQDAKKLEVERQAIDKKLSSYKVRPIKPIGT